MADAELGVLGREPLVKLLAKVRLAVAVGVLEVEDVRGARHDQASTPGHEAVGKE